jgi:hypothetical protein
MRGNTSCRRRTACNRSGSCDNSLISYLLCCKKWTEVTALKKLSKAEGGMEMEKRQSK